MFCFLLFHPGEPVPPDSLTHSEDFQVLHLLSLWLQEATGLESRGQCLVSIRCVELQGNGEDFVGRKTEAVGEVREAIRAVRRGKNLGQSSARTEEEKQRTRL